MNSLNPEEKDLILDFYFNCGSDERLDQARDLIAASPAASELYASLEQTLTTLDHVKYEPCPDNLVELTVARLKLVSAGSNWAEDSEAYHETDHDVNESSFDQDVKPMAEIAPTSPRSFWGNFSNILATAATILVVASLAFPSLKQVRQIALCKANMMHASQGIERYASDNNGKLPALASAMGAPWWNMTRQAKQAKPDTSHLYQLIKDEYVQGKYFVCPGRKDAKVLTLTPAQIAKHNDFPSRNNLSYSFTLNFGDQTSGSKVLLADRNPIFEDIIAKLRDDSFKMLSLDDSQMNSASLNHRQKGQVILFRDGSVRFSKTRIVNKDDIYTIKDQRSYKGCETPGSKDDVFLVP